ncbi:MAG: orotate phosphoribosyltransferase [Pirellulales bacterium]|nr:orotate phosphoribosyltransferase [Pirellulales bacterium]
MYDKSALAELVKAKALKFGEFKLVSGQISHYYLDGKQVTLDSEGSRLVGLGILELLGEDLPDAVGGMSIGADPITAAVLTIAGVQKKPLRGFMVRKEAKGHGLKKYIEGPVQNGEDVVIVEDVVTTGGSSLLAIERCKEFGLNVHRVIAIIDRLQGGREAFEQAGYEFSSLLNIRELGVEPLAASS